jgi:pantothenate kinase
LRSRKNAFLIAVVGIPGSGKSTLCEALSKRLPGSVVVPMDGYHLPRSELSPEQMKRRGAPHTFASATLREDLKRLQKNRIGTFPSFDHAVKDPRPNAIQVGHDCSLVIVEGNYLLLQAWELVDLFDFKIFLDCDIRDAMNRVRQRLVACGITSTYAEATVQVQSNDFLNARRIIEDGCESRADLTVCSTNAAHIP